MRIRSLDAADGTILATATEAESGTAASPLRPNATASGQPMSYEPWTATAGGTSTAARTRDQRYQELLRSAPPSTGTAAQASNAQIAPVANPNPPAPMLERVAKPVAKVSGVNRPLQPPQAMAARQPQGSGGPNTRVDSPKEPEEKRDEDSDVTPPRLVGAEFVPPQVQDGEQTTFFATVTDDLSGVRSISGVVVSPSGAQQGFACQREGEGGRFFARITVPKDAAEGQWMVKYLSLADNAGNTINLNVSQGSLPGSASFRVTSSGSDSKGPTLKAVWLDQSSMGAGEKNQVSVQAEDDKSGVNLVSGVFVSPSKQARIGFGCRSVSGSLWQCPVTPPTCVDCGSWQLEQVQLQDKANNMTTVRADNPVVGNVRLELYGKECDNSPPVITSLSVDPPVVSNAEGGVIRITAIATDNQCGVANLSGVALPPANAGNTRIYIPFKPAGEGTDTYVGEIVVPQHAPSGTWTIGWIQALDKGHNLKAYSSSDPVIARVTFRVE